MVQRIQPTLALLDQGLSLYRKHFASFVLLSAAWFVPVAVLVGLGIALGSRIDIALAILLALVGALVLFVLMIYLVAVLSRAAALALDGQPLRVGALLRLNPLRLLGMTFFTLIYLVLAQIASSIISLICICPAYIFGVALISGAAALGSNGGFMAAGFVFVIVFAAIYVFGVFISGATYGGLIYSLQPWVQQPASFGVSLQQSIELMIYRFWRNIGAWGLAALILAAVGLTVSIVIGVILPLPLIWAFGTDAPVVRAVTVSAWLLGLILVLPPLPIWMAMLYRRNRNTREGVELQAQISAWLHKHALVEQHVPAPNQT